MMGRTVSLVAPYVAWMVLMSVLPQTAGAYALRGAVTAALLVAGGLWAARDRNVASPLVVDGPAARDRNVASPLAVDGPVARDRNVASPLVVDGPVARDRNVASPLMGPLLAGLGVGVLVFAVWIAPEAWLWPDRQLASGGDSPYAPAACGWALTLAKLAASAFVISVAEELFFRKWLVAFAGFGWMLVLFGVEHMRWDLGVARGSVFIAEGVFAGLCYGLLAKRYGIVSAIVAHAVTNLVLGLYVIGWDKWMYW